MDMKDKTKHEVKVQSKGKTISSTGSRTEKYQRAKTWQDDQFWEKGNYTEEGKQIWRNFLKDMITTARKRVSVNYETVREIKNGVIGERIMVARTDTSLDKSPLNN